MKKLLVHSNNTSFNVTSIFSISEQFVFDIDFDKDADFYIYENLTNGELKRQLEETDVVFIKISLSQNYLEYFGLRLAYYIRLTKSLGDTSNIPIIFVGEESIQFLGLTYSEPSILFTRGIYFMRETIDDFNRISKLYKDGNIKGLKNFDDFVKTIQINPPANYLTHHSIANEWCILRWAKVLGVASDESLLQRIKKDIESLLYFKFLQVKYPIDSDPELVTINITGQGKILYIDDEWDKGWDFVLNKLMSTNPKAVFEVFQYNFKDKSQENIVDACVKKILEYNPDVVLLDLRLCDLDFNCNNSKDLSGYKVLERIKSINPGIQVLIFTASNKVWNLTELQRAGADDFILKESPELSVDASYSKRAIEKMVSSISNAFEMSFLKKVHNKSNEIVLYGLEMHADEVEFNLRLKNSLEIAFKLLSDTKISDKYFNYAYLQIFQIIEDFCELPSVFNEDGDSYVVINKEEVCVQKVLKDNIEQPICLTAQGKYEIKKKSLDKKPDAKIKKLDTNFKVSALLIFRYGNTNSSVLKWTDIYSNRNTKAAHFNVADLLTETNIYMVLDFIIYIIDSNNVNRKNIEKGLSKKSFKESLTLLKDFYKK